MEFRFIAFVRDFAFAHQLNFVIPDVGGSPVKVETYLIDHSDLHKSEDHDEFYEMNTVFSSIGNVAIHVEVSGLIAYFHRSDVPSAVCDALHNVAQGEKPAGIDESLRGQWEAFLPEPYLQDIAFLPPIEIMPASYQRFVLKMLEDLVNSIERLIRLIAWRENIRIGSRPLYGGNLYWRDSGPWIEMSTYRMEFAPLNIVRDPQLDSIGVLSLMNTPDNLMVSRELLGEAWGLCMFNTRGALVMGIAAAEIGSKQCIQALAEDTAWFLGSRNVPSVESLVWELLPQLTHRFRIFPIRMIPPAKTEVDHLRDTFCTGVLLRNRISHVDPVLPSIKRTRETLAAVSDLLYFFDYIQGYEWAIEYVSERTRREWVVPIDNVAPAL